MYEDQWDNLSFGNSNQKWEDKLPLCMIVASLEYCCVFLHNAFNLSNANFKLKYLTTPETHVQLNLC